MLLLASVLRFGLRIQSLPKTCRFVKNTTCGVPYQILIKKHASTATMSSTLPEEVDAVIVGGGSVGCSLAYHFAKLNGGNVVLLEKNKITSGTTWHTAGILWSYRPSESETLMQLQTRDLISSILPSINEEEAGWLKTGAIHIAKNEEQYNDLKQISTLAKALSAEVIEVGREDVPDIHPLLRTDDVFGAVYSPGDGIMDPATYCMALVKAAAKFGAQIIENCPVTDITTTTDDMGHKRVASVVTAMGAIKTKNVINCAGAWAPYIGKMAGVRIPQLAYKHAYVVTESIPGIRGTPIVKDHGTVYIKPQGETVQYGGYEMNPHLINKLPEDFAFGLYDLDWEIFEQHYKAAANRLPDIEKVGIRSSVCGPDGRPNIGESPELRGFFVGSAFNSGGMMLGGGAGRQLASWICNGKPEIDLFNCDIKRYPRNLNNYNKWLLETCHEKFTKRLGTIYKHDHGTGGRNQKFSPLHKIHYINGALFASKSGFERPAYYVNDKKGERNDLDVLPYDFYGHYDNQKHESYPYYEAVLKDCSYDFPETSHTLIGRECLTCRTSAALFDVSFMSKYQMSGRDVEAAVKLLFSKEVNRSGRMTYALMLNKDAGIESDAIVAKINNSSNSPTYYITTPSVSEQHCLSHMERVLSDAGLRCQIDNVTEHKAILSLQGPKSKNILQGLVTGVSLSDLRYAQWASAKIGGREIILARLSFVGELGYEIHCSSSDAQHIYDVINDAHTLSLAGYRAMESLSTESGFHHWPHSICNIDNPIESGLLRFCDNTTNYLGSTALHELRKKPIKKRFVNFEIECNVPVFGGEAIWRDGILSGYLRGGEFSYVLGSNIGCGYLELNRSMSTLDDDVICEGKYEIERMGYRYPAKLSNLFTSSQRRLKGTYKKQEQSFLHDLLKAL